MNKRILTNRTHLIEPPCIAIVSNRLDSDNSSLAVRRAASDRKKNRRQPGVPRVQPRRKPASVAKTKTRAGLLCAYAIS